MICMIPKMNLGVGEMRFMLCDLHISTVEFKTYIQEDMDSALICNCNCVSVSNGIFVLLHIFNIAR